MWVQRHVFTTVVLYYCYCSLVIGAALNENAKKIQYKEPRTDSLPEGFDNYLQYDQARNGTSTAPPGPVVTLLNGMGTVHGTSDGRLEKFRGIPFAYPPVGPLRFRPPVRYNKTGVVYRAYDYGPSCVPMIMSGDAKSKSGFLDRALAAFGGAKGLMSDALGLSSSGNHAEDCLSLNIARPAYLSPKAKLPVMVWIYGGGFEDGQTKTYDPKGIVAESVALGMPIIFVSMNYRMAGYGFLPGKEVKEERSGNVGLLDQRMAIEWVADNIEAFGGDPSKVTIFGESAGAISVGHQLLLYDGDINYKAKPLFRAAIMQSGSIVPVKPIDAGPPQAIFNQVAAAGGCAKAEKKLDCLRKLPEKEYTRALSTVPSFHGYKSLDLSYVPRPDGVYLRDSPYDLIAQGKYAKVPMIIGDQEDEGSMFALLLRNVTTNAEFQYYVNSIFIDATPSDMNNIARLYPDDPAYGSPFRTGRSNNIFPQYKRLAAILGDMTFQWPRRYCLDKMNHVPRWSFQAATMHQIPIVGTFHGCDLLFTFFVSTSLSRVYRGYFVSFAHHLDPNKGNTSLINWPQYGPDKSLLSIGMSARHLSIIKDTFREKVSDFVNANVNHFKI